ncbi:MAG: hypothetical protein IPI66_07330 [Chitinophagaceae bacterium]|nr:hypothetical protein [Chitinophagaceae bacterium]
MLKKIMVILVCCLPVAGMSQGKLPSDRDYAQKPLWIKMMETESVNFNEALKAYDLYWQNHELPEEEGDRYTGRSEPKTKLSKKEMKALREAADMRFQIKRFLNWKIMNEPYVKENGNIMTADEKLKYYQQHQQ